ncbi:MAG: hypothetical protein Q8K34_12110 [Hydrogenophaga sp.]|nr:hypothetical protein [Hydrogenophaga sp.]MDP3922812.1 hypothetical protein [Hydrogenophaga sp.]
MKTTQILKQRDPNACVSVLGCTPSCAAALFVRLDAPRRTWPIPWLD